MKQFITFLLGKTFFRKGLISGLMTNDIEYNSFGMRLDSNIYLIQ